MLTHVRMPLKSQDLPNPCQNAKNSQTCTRNDALECLYLTTVQVAMQLYVQVKGEDLFAYILYKDHLYPIRILIQIIAS